MSITNGINIWPRYNYSATLVSPSEGKTAGSRKPDKLRTSLSRWHKRLTAARLRVETTKLQSV